MATEDNQSEETQAIGSLPTSPNLASPLKPAAYLGTTLKDRYLIEKELGRGGIGVVYLARDTQLLSKPVVVKVLLEEQEESAHSLWFKRKFQQEIEALVRIDHPGVVGVLDAGQMPDGRSYFVMQFVEGVTLRSVLSDEGLELARVASVVRQTGQALSAAHDKGVYHRDLKPENIMLQTLSGGQELVKLIDFGIATVKDSRVASGSEKTKVAGALPYMAPEQLRGQPVAASDIFSLGVIAYEMVTGQLPFDADSVVQLYELQQTGRVIKPQDLRPELPDAAQALILRALSFEPRQRPPQARDFGEQLSRALTGEAGPRGVHTLPPAQTSALTPEMAHVLFMDLVGYSKLPMEEQKQTLRQLREVVRGTIEFQRAQQSDQLISLPTGDGMALVFFRDPVAPVRCALEVASALQGEPQIKLRMGLHSGPVYRVADINTNINVSGGGINLAQRVMDCGDAGHILLSNTVAEVLGQVGKWGEYLQDLGEQEVKHGVRVHLFNLYTGELGNPEVPEKVRPAPPAPAPPPEESRSSPLRAEAGRTEKVSRRAPLLASIAAVALLALGLAVWPWRPSPPPAPAPEPAAVAPAAPELKLSYSITARRDPQRYPGSKPFLLPGETIFGPGDEVRLRFSSPQDGYLYLLNEAPALKNGRPDYNLLFPLPTINGGSALLKANQQVQIPEKLWFRLDQQEGAEKIWLIWSAQQVAELEAVKKWANEEDKGEIKDPSQVQALQEFLTKHQAAVQPEVKKGEEQTSISGKGDVLVHLVKLEHR